MIQCKAVRQFYFLLEKEVLGGFEWFTKFKTNRTQEERINMKDSVAQSKCKQMESEQALLITQGIFLGGEKSPRRQSTNNTTANSSKFLGRPAASVSYLDDFGQCLFPDLRHLGCSSPVCPHTLP